MLNVLDCSALLELPEMVADLGSALDTFTDLVDDGELTFCDEVLAELKKRALGDAVYTWAKAVAPTQGSRGL